VATHFGDSDGESTISRTSTMKGGNSNTNGYNLNKNNIFRTTFETLMEEGNKSTEAYHANLKELFLSHYEMMQQGPILKDTMPIIIRKAEVTPEVWTNPSLSLNDVQSMINSALERQARSTDELMCRLIEEQDGKRLAISSVNHSSSSAVNFTKTNPKLGGTSTGGATMPNPSAQLMNHFHSQPTTEGLTPIFEML
jgi:hypothetical protein